MLNLLPAGDAGRDDNGFGLRLDAGEEALTPDVHRDVVVFLLVSERAGHPAASGIHVLDIVSRRQRLLQRSASEERFFVAMTVDERLGPGVAVAQVPSPGLDLTDDELFEQKGRERDFRRCGTVDQVEVLITEREHAAGFAADDGVSRTDQ